MLTVIDECTRECLAVPVARRLNSDDVLAVLVDLFALRGPPEHIRSDNAPEFTATAVRDWLGRLGVKTAFIEPGSPWDCRGAGNGPRARFPKAGPQRELRRHAAQRAARSGGAPHTHRDPRADRRTAPALRQHALAIGARVSNSGARGPDHAKPTCAMAAVRVRSASSQPQRRSRRRLNPQTEPPMGAGQPEPIKVWTVSN